MIKTCISKSWLFEEQISNNMWWKDSDVEKMVDLPHDYAIHHPRTMNGPGGEGTGYYEGGMGRYTKYLKFENKKHTILDIDGAYMCAEIRLNKDLLAIHPNGYMPFLVDLTDYIYWGKHNKIEILTNDIAPSARWYSGAGLYRDVFLWTGGSVRIEPWDLYVVTNSAREDKANITVKLWISSDFNTDADVKIIIKDKNGNKAAESVTTIKALKDTKNSCDIDFEIENPLLWDTENPNLYTLDAEVIANGEITDTFRQTFGIREILFSVKDGMTLNGKKIKLKGGCIHHDHGALGAASYPAAEMRKVKKLKEAGFNSLRTAHNPQSDAFMDACDKLGIIVMDEAFDMWRSAKKANDYHLWFEDWWARDISYMIKRDRIHPCIASYSIGNEIHEANGRSNGALWSKKLTEEVKKYDTSRPVTSALASNWDGFDLNRTGVPEDYKEVYMRGHKELGLQKEDLNSEWDLWMNDFMEPLDIVGYNYGYRRYEYDIEKYPNRIIWGSETYSNTIFEAWDVIKKHNNLLGDFNWTAYDNIGEIGAGRGEWRKEKPEENERVVPLVIKDIKWRTCWQGDMELTGFRRPQSYFREAVWNEKFASPIFTTHPSHNGEYYVGTGWHWQDVCDTWTFDDKYLGIPVKTEVYTLADEVRFVLNGKSVGTAKPQKGVASVNIPYEKGELRADTYKDGKLIISSVLKTTGDAKYIKIIPETTEILADGKDLAYFEINITDDNGNRIVNAKNKLKCCVSGGELLCIFSGDPCTEDDYISPVCHAFGGRAIAIVKTEQKGNVKITVESDNLISDSSDIIAK